jgi:hypothetical protein
LQAVQMSFFYILPSILLSGFMFPFRGMPAWAQALGSVIPVTHFLRVVRGSLLKGLGLRGPVAKSCRPGGICRGDRRRRHVAVPTNPGLR